MAPITHAAHDTPITGADYEEDHVGGAYWDLVINQTGTSFASFTAATGTWSSNGTEIIQTDTGASWRRAKFNTQLPSGFPWILEAEVQSATSGGTNRVGLGITDGANDAGLSVSLDSGSSAGINVDRDNGTAIRYISQAVSTATWYKLRVVMGSAWVSVYVDTVLLGSVPLMFSNTWDTNTDFFTLLSYGASVKWRNIKVWTLSGGVPA